MELLTLPILRNKELQTFTSEAKKICKPIALLKENIKNVEAAEAKFLNGMLKDKAIMVSKDELDRTRDHYYSGMIQSIKAERNFPYREEEKIAAIDEVWNIVSKHGTSITRLPYNEETAAIDNLLKDINNMESVGLLSENVTRWFSVVSEANENFKVASNEFINKSTAKSIVESATKSAPALREALQNMLVDLFSHNRIAQTDELNEAYAKMTTLVGSYH